MTDLEIAMDHLKKHGYTCVLVKGDVIYTSTERGIRPLMQWLEQEADCHGFSAADKVVGKATAFLYARMGVCHIYAGIMSTGAAEVLDRFGIPYSFEKRVDAILNRTKDGFCPMESAVRQVDDPELAFEILSEKYSQMNLKKSAR